MHIATILWGVSVLTLSVDKQTKLQMQPLLMRRWWPLLTVRGCVTPKLLYSKEIKLLQLQMLQMEKTVRGVL